MFIPFYFHNIQYSHGISHSFDIFSTSKVRFCL
jgi:hypothetical protein